MPNEHQGVYPCRDAISRNDEVHLSFNNAVPILESAPANEQSAQALVREAQEYSRQFSGSKLVGDLRAPHQQMDTTLKEIKPEELAGTIARADKLLSDAGSDMKYLDFRGEIFLGRKEGDEYHTSSMLTGRYESDLCQGAVPQGERSLGHGKQP